MTQPATPDWHAALAYALTGARLPVTPARAPDPKALLTELATFGWGSEQLAAVAGVAHAVPPDLMTGLGPAQFWAALAQLRREVGASGVVPQAPTRRTDLTAEEERLLADRPPHW